MCHVASITPRKRIVATPGNLSQTMKTATKKTQCQRLLAYLRKNRKGITTMEAFENLRITCLHKRISELEESLHFNERTNTLFRVVITRSTERTESGSTVTRYKLAR